MGVDRSSLSSSGVARRPARATGDGLAVVGQQSAPQGTDLGQNDDFGSCNLDSIHQGGPIFEGPTCFVRRQERMIKSPIFSSGEPGPQLLGQQCRGTHYPRGSALDPRSDRSSQRGGQSILCAICCDQRQVSLQSKVK